MIIYIHSINCKLLRAREKPRVQGAIGFNFASQWLKNWREILKPVNKRSNCNRVITLLYTADRLAQHRSKCVGWVVDSNPDRPTTQDLLITEEKVLPFSCNFISKWLNAENSHKSKGLCRVLDHVDVGVNSHLKNCSIKRVDKDQVTIIVNWLTLEIKSVVWLCACVRNWPNRIQLLQVDFNFLWNVSFVIPLR